LRKQESDAHNNAQTYEHHAADVRIGSAKREPFDGDWDLGSNGTENPIMTGNDFQPFQKRDEMSDLFRLLFTTSWGKVSSVHLKRSG
jgi:hypothetical protein